MVLFDEIEKAHADVLNLLLQLLDEGMLTDSRGRRISFANTVVVLTSNVGCERIGAGSQAMSFSHGRTTATAQQRLAQEVLGAAQKTLHAELWSRLDERLVFAPLNASQVASIAAKQLQACAEQLEADRQISLSWDDAVVNFLCRADVGTQGARHVRQNIVRHVQAPIADMIIAGKIKGAVQLRLSLTPEQDAVRVGRNNMPRRVRAVGHGVATRLG